MLNDVRGRWKVSSRHSDRRNLLFPPDCDSTGFSRGKIKDTNQRLQDLLRRANQPDILILTGDNNARMGWLPSNDEHLKSRLALKFWRLGDKERLLTHGITVSLYDPTDNTSPEHNEFYRHLPRSRCSARILCSLPVTSTPKLAHPMLTHCPSWSDRQRESHPGLFPPQAVSDKHRLSTHLASTFEFTALNSDRSRCHWSLPRQDQG